MIIGTLECHASWPPPGIRLGTQGPDPGWYLATTVSYWAIFRVIHRLSQSEDLPALVGALLVAHLQGHKRVVSLIGAHVEADGAVVLGR